MNLGFTFVGSLDAKKFNTDERLRRAANMLGGMLLKRANGKASGDPSLIACREDSTITVQCLFHDIEPVFLDEMNAYLQEVMRTMNSIDERKLDR